MGRQNIASARRNILHRARYLNSGIAQPYIVRLLCTGCSIFMEHLLYVIILNNCINRMESVAMVIIRQSPVSPNGFRRKVQIIKGRVVVHRFKMMHILRIY